MLMLMMIMGNKDNCLLNRTAPVPWPSPLTRVVSLDSLSPVLSLTGVCGSWQTPLSWSHHLSPHWTSLWARDSAQSSRARVTSSYSHCHIVRFTTHPARKSGNLNQSPISEGTSSLYDCKLLKSVQSVSATSTKQRSSIAYLPQPSPLHRLQGEEIVQPDRAVHLCLARPEATPEHETDENCYCANPNNIKICRSA